MTKETKMEAEKIMPGDCPRFRIYYAVWDAKQKVYHDWTHEGSTILDVIDAPTDGVQCIVQENPTKEKGYDKISRFDVYVWRGDQGWIGVTEEGLRTYLREKGFAKYVIHGYNVRNDAFHDAISKASAEGLG